jgi:hypothetical protein
MPKITLPKQTMLDILYDSADVVSDKVTGNGRWSIHHTLIFKYEGKLYRTSYSVGATESQDESPWEYSPNVESTEVEEYQKSVVDYRAVA